MPTPTIPVEVSVGFVLLTLAVLIALATLARRVAPRLWWLIGLMIGWTALTAGVALSGVLAEFGSGQPRLPVLIMIPLIFVGWLAWLSPASLHLAMIPQAQLVALQCFRLPVELLLARMASERLLAVEMTYYGRNFDVLIGIAALFVAYRIAVDGEEATKFLVVGWNMLGLMLVTAVLVHGILSIPYPFQPLSLSVPTFAIAYFPIVWLPTVLVPVAYLLHFVSLRRCFAQSIGTPESAES